MTNDTLFQSFTTFINTLYGFTEKIKKDLKPNAVTPVQNEILLCLYANHTKSVSEISDSLNLNLPNTSRELKKLTDLELIAKKADSDDKRKSNIMLSTKGNTLMTSSFSAIEQDFNSKINDYSEEEILELINAIKLINEKLISKII